MGNHGEPFVAARHGNLKRLSHCEARSSLEKSRAATKEAIQKAPTQPNMNYPKKNNEK